MSDEDILNNLILHNYIAKNHKDMINKTYRSKLFWGISIDIKNNFILMCYNHAISDGYRSMLPVQRILFGLISIIRILKPKNSLFRYIFLYLSVQGLISERTG